VQHAPIPPQIGLTNAAGILGPENSRYRPAAWQQMDKDGVRGDRSELDTPIRSIQSVPPAGTLRMRNRRCAGITKVLGNSMFAIRSQSRQRWRRDARAL